MPSKKTSPSEAPAATVFWPIFAAGGRRQGLRAAGGRRQGLRGAGGLRQGLRAAGGLRQGLRGALAAAFRRLSPLLVFAFGAAMLWPALEAAAQLKAGGQEVFQVRGEGVSGYRVGDAGRSREEALEAAQRDAVEKVSGVMIESESRMRNFALVKDEVLSRSEGFIKTFKVIGEGREGELYKVLIDALVVKAAFMRDVNASLENLYRRVGKPRVMVVIGEKLLDPGGVLKTGAAGKQRIAEKEIRKIFIKQGFTFVDARAAVGADLIKMALAGGDIPREKAVEAARTVKAEIIIVGSAVTREKGPFSSFFRAQTELSLDVVRIDSGQIIASEVVTARGLAIHQGAASTQAVTKAAREMAPKMMEQVSYVWLKDRNEGGRIELVVKNAAFGDLLVFKRALAMGVGGMKNLRQRSYKAGTALFELQTRKTAEQIAESLFEIDFKKFSLDIEDVSAKALTVSLAKPQPPAGKAAAPGGKQPPARESSDSEGKTAVRKEKRPAAGESGGSRGNAAAARKGKQPPAAPNSGPPKEIAAPKVEGDEPEVAPARRDTGGLRGRSSESAA